MITLTPPRWKYLEDMIDGRVMYVNEKLNNVKGHGIVLFPAGQTAEMLCNTLMSEGKDVVFFIDNNPVARRICNKEIRHSSCVEEDGFAAKYIVILASSHKNNSDIKEQLPYNCTVIDWYSYIISQNWMDIKLVAETLDDDVSRYAYFSSVYGQMTGDFSYIECVPDQYFALPTFNFPFGEVLVDCGAFVGDSFEQYVYRSYGNIRVYAFEASPSNVIACKVRAKRLYSEFAMAADSIVIEQLGVGSTRGELKFTQNSAVNCRSNSDGEMVVNIIPLDDYFRDKKCPTIIKTDVEGMDYDVIVGAKELISQNYPKLAISIYHTPVDLTRIPQYIRKIAPEYSHFSVRTHHADYQDTILYVWK